MWFLTFVLPTNSYVSAKTWVSTINVVINLPLTEPSTFMDQYPLFPSKPHQVLKMNKDELDLG